MGHNYYFPKLPDFSPIKLKFTWPQIQNGRYRSGFKPPLTAVLTLFGAIAQYRPLYSRVGVLWRTRFVTVVAIFIPWDANKWPGILPWHWRIYFPDSWQPCESKGHWKREYGAKFTVSSIDLINNCFTWELSQPEYQLDNEKVSWHRHRATRQPWEQVHFSGQEIWHKHLYWVYRPVI